MKNKPPSLLIADDDPEDMQMLSDMFRQQNPDVNITCVKDGQQALSFLLARNVEDLPAMIIVNYKMPLLNGLDVLRLLHAQSKFRNITKVVWGTLDNKAYIDECLKYGADLYFVKPSGIAELNKIIDHLTTLLTHAVVRASPDN